MNLDAFRGLLTPAGHAALVLAKSYEPTPATIPACVDRVAKAHPAPIAKAAVETVLLRAKARGKFPEADRLYFTREALEQSSGWTIASYRASRFAEYDRVADLCCGIGGDTLALADRELRVVSIEQDPLLAMMTRANAEAMGFADRVEVRLADVLSTALDTPAAFADPGRRSGQRRFLALADYLPPPTALRDRFPMIFPLAFKLAPGISRAELDDWDAEAEFISVDGELKECVLWCGPLKSATRRATLLRTEGGCDTFAGDADADPRRPANPNEFIFDLDDAIIRAELEHDLAKRLDLQPIDNGIALFTGKHATPTPFGDWYRVEYSAPFHVGRLRDELRQRKVGRVTMLKRASSLDVNEVMRKLKLAGDGHRHVILTRSLGEPWMILCEKLTPSASSG